MQITRRGFLTMTGAIGGGVALSSFGLNLNPTRGYADELSKMDRIKIAKQVITTCAYCSVGCGLVRSVDKTTGKIFNIEGDADHPINEGSLCAKGAGFFDLTEANKHRLTKVLYRKPGGTEWEEKDWDFAIPRIARLVKDARDKGFVKTNAKGELVNSAQEIWDNELSVLAPSMAGIKYARLENDGIQWPAPNEDHPGTPTLHKDGKFTCGLGVLKAIDWIPPAEVPDKEYPFVLSTGRRLYHYHTRTQTGRSQGINALLGEETADISAIDAEAKGITDGEMISVKSRRGVVAVKARVTRQVPEGMVWMAFHFREACANWLTNPVYDPMTQTAEYKACAVRIDRLE